MLKGYNVKSSQMDTYFGKMSIKYFATTPNVKQGKVVSCFWLDVNALGLLCLI